MAICYLSLTNRHYLIDKITASRTNLDLNDVLIGYSQYFMITEIENRIILQ
jgi:hypothetical protein